MVHTHTPLYIFLLKKLVVLLNFLKQENVCYLCLARFDDVTNLREKDSYDEPSYNDKYVHKTLKRKLQLLQVLPRGENLVPECLIDWSTEYNKIHLIIIKFFFTVLYWKLDGYKNLFLMRPSIY